MILDEEPKTVVKSEDQEDLQQMSWENVVKTEEEVEEEEEEDNDDWKNIPYWKTMSEYEPKTVAESTDNETYQQQYWMLVVKKAVEEEEKAKEEAEEEEEEEEVNEENFEKFETGMDVLYFIKERIFHPAIIPFLQSPYRANKINKCLNELEIFITKTPLNVQHADNRLYIMQNMLLLACSTIKFTKNFFRKKLTNERGKHNTSVIFISSLEKTMSAIMENRCEANIPFVHKLINSITNSLHHVKNLEMALLDAEDISSYCIPLNFESAELLLIKAFPDFIKRVKESSDMVNLISELSHQLAGSLPCAIEIEKACGDNPQAVLLVGGLLSFRPDRNTWGMVQNDLQEKNMRPLGDDGFNIFAYCLRDLPESLRQCFLYLACYPKGYEIPTASVTKIWIAEGFITPEEGETTEETVNKYVEQLVQRLLIWVSMRSLSGTIKCFRLSHTIRNYVIRYTGENSGTMKTDSMVVNPNGKKMESLERVAIHKWDQYKEVKCICLHSFLAFGIDRNVLGSAKFLRVLELRNSVIRETVLENMPNLQYLGLRGSKISELPENIGNMQNLQTLDVRDTNVQILPESLWNISALCHVYVNPGPRIQGPPPTANIPNLEILKTVRVPESWLENVPNLSINLRKLALSYAGHLELEAISKPLSHTVNLLSIAIMGPIVHAELADTRAFPNLNTLKSIKFVGIWNFRKLPIDNVEFPSNLVKLILSNSRLKEDPMPALERLQVLKLLRLEDGAYMGEKMVCSAHGFPQLQFLQLSQLENLKIWEVKPMAMSQLTKLRVVQCRELKNLPSFEHVKGIVIYN